MSVREGRERLPRTSAAQVPEATVHQTARYCLATFPSAGTIDERPKKLSRCLRRLALRAGSALRQGGRYRSSCCWLRPILGQAHLYRNAPVGRRRNLRGEQSIVSRAADPVLAAHGLISIRHCQSGEQTQGRLALSFRTHARAARQQRTDVRNRQDRPPSGVRSLTDPGLAGTDQTT